MRTRVKFATQVDEELLAQTRAIAESEGRQIQAVIEEALIDLVEKKRGGKPRAQVMAHYEASIAHFGSVYEKVAE
jgi:hypothetical protein